ncbi:protein FAM200C-like [Palaemon carinicauda]|uniref:protein FAM200C-like n=1 Tax=Palaemon carinicauda TaxID=392227 RepID=UPI0035B6A256
MAKIVLVKEAEKKLQQVSLSNDVIHNRIIDMNGDILKQVVADIKASPVKISIQVDESTDYPTVVQELAIHFNDPSLVQMLAYLTDVFSALNELNLSLQGRGLNILPASEKFAAFKEKLVLWVKRVKMGNLLNFPYLEEAVKENSTLPQNFVAKFFEHMQMLFTFFDGYFSCGEIKACNNWILNPFMQNWEDVDDDGSIREDVIDMRHNLGIQMEFTNSQLVHFWAS